MRTATKPTRRTGKSKPDGIAVIDEAGIWHDGVFVAAPPIGDLLDAWNLAHDLGVRQLWMTAGAVASSGLPATIGRETVHPFLEAGSLNIPRGQRHLAGWLSAWSPDHYVEVSVPSWDRGSPFHGLDFAPVLAGEVLEFMEATGMMWRRSGAITSDAWLRDHHRSTGLLVPTDYPEIASVTDLEPDLQWHREPVGPELKALRCFAYDLNAMYLGAASSLRLPAGAFTHWKGREGQIVFTGDINAPGYWWESEDGGWATTPTNTYRFGQPWECFYWPQSHRYLEPWYRALRDARTKLLDFPSPALEAVKQVYREGIGRFGSTRRSNEADPLYQPYWRHALQAEARTRLQRRMSTFTQAPVAVDVDCCYFLTSAKSPENFARKVGIPIGTGIGQFKVATKGPGKPVREVLRDPDFNAMIKELRKLGPPETGIS